MAAGMTRQEQETIISFNAAEDTAELYTADPVYIRKMDKLTEKNPEQFKLRCVEKCQGEIIAKRYIFPKRFISIRSKDIKRELTEKRRKELAERLKAVR